MPLTISGKLKSPSGASLPQAELLFRAVDTSTEVVEGSSSSFLTDTSGNYVFSLAYGVYDVFLRPKGDRVFVRLTEGLTVDSKTVATDINNLVKERQGELTTTPEVLLEFRSIRADVEQNRKDSDTYRQMAQDSSSDASTAMNGATLARQGAESARDSSYVYSSNSAMSATAALASELAAKASETSATSSKTSASSSATSATSSKNAAAASATAAATSETNAATSATAAASSATSANSSKTSATSSATSATASAAAAAQSATAASTSETNAKSSETKAKTSETNAKSSETKAKTSETNAAASEVAAATSEAYATNSKLAAETAEANAKASETAAASSATSANSSKTSASSSASSATSSKNAAATSETNAKTSETNAKTSETNAAASEASALASKTSATSSASSATSSKNAAATSATAAANSATAAATSETNAKASETAAAASETAAASSASSASSSKSSASSSATSATNSKNAAASSEANAAASATAAATSETNAKASETAAASSKTSASSSASSATTSKNAAAASATAAAASEASAAAWADTAVGVAISTGKYSARHWAEEAKNAVTGALVYQGGWSAASGSYPANPAKGHFYKVTTSGTVSGKAYAVGDQILYNGSSWDHISNNELVTSVGGNVGAISDQQLLDAIKRKDGASSGLDADLLDGQQGSYYLSASNLNAGTVPADRLPAASTSAVGAVKKATDAEALAGTSGVFPDANQVMDSYKQFGLGAAKDISDADATTLTGIYRFGVGALATPLKGTVSTAGSLWVSQWTSGSIMQIALIFYPSTHKNKLFTRVLEGGNWTAWATSYSENFQGAGSGMDADLLDGQQGSYYLSASNLNAGTVPAARLPAASTSAIGAVERADDTETHAGTSNVIPDARQVQLAFKKFGLGGVGQTTSNIDLDTVTESGFYNINSTTVNAWTGFLSGDTLINTVYNSTHKSQIGVSQLGHIWFRAQDNGTWRAWSKLWHDNNMGAGSGLDADLLDGQQGSYYLSASNLNAGTVPSGRLSGTYNVSISGNAATATNATKVDNLTSSQLARADVNNSSLQITLPAKFLTDAWGTYPLGVSTFEATPTEGWPDYGTCLTVNLSAHRAVQTYITKPGVVYTRSHNSTAWTALVKQWAENSQGSGTGMDADLLDGQHGAYYRSASNLNAGTVPVARLPAATESSIGAVEFATTAEAKTTATNLAVTPAGVQEALSQWGIGSSNALANGTDLDTVTTPAIYHQATNSSAASGSNYPEAQAGIMQVWTAGGAITMQLYITYNTGRVYTRTRYNTTWTPWAKQWSSERQGSGTGMDADMVDGLQASQFLRSDEDTTLNGKILTISGEGDATGLRLFSGSDAAGVRLRNPTGNNGEMEFWTTDDYDEPFVFRAYDVGNKGTGVYREWFKIDNNGAYVSGQPVWHPGNDGAGSGLDADLLDGLDSSSFLRADGAGYQTTKQALIINSEGHVGDGGNDYGLMIKAFEPSISFIDKTTNGGSALWKFNSNVLQLWMDAGNDETIGHSANTTDELILNISRSGTFQYQGSKIWHAGNDGAGSTLDADLLDGQQGDYYLNAGNLTGTIAGARLSGAYDIDVTGASRGVSVQDTRNVASVPNGLAAKSLTYEFKSKASAGTPPVMAHGSYAHILNLAGWDSASGSGGWPVQMSLGDGLAVRQAINADTWGNWRKVWHDGNMGSGSGLDADTLRGSILAESVSGNSVVKRDSSGDVKARLFRSEFSTTNSNVQFIMTQIDQSGNNYLRPTTPDQFRAAVTDSAYLGKTATASDASKLGGVSSGQYLRADVSNSLGNSTYLMYANNPSLPTGSFPTSGGGLVPGNGDNATSTTANVKIASWKGVGFAPTISGQTVPVGENAVWIDTRTGALSARGNVTAYSSDARLKENIEVIPNALAKVSQLRGVTYDWRKECRELGFEPTNPHEHGVIAQEVQSVVPDAVAPAPFNEEYLTVRYERLIPLLIESVKELSEKVSRLEARH